MPIAIKKIETEKIEEKTYFLNKIFEIKNSNSNIIKIYDIIEDKNNIYILLEDKKENISILNNLLYNDVIKEKSIKGQVEPFENNKFNFLSKEAKKSICKISNLNAKGTGFFCTIPIKNKNINVLVTNYHVLNENHLKEGIKISLEFANRAKKEIEINLMREIFLNEKLDYTCIQILESDGISKFFEINNNILDENINNSEIVLFQFPKQKEFSFSQGIIKRVCKNKIYHSAPTDLGSSGSPIILINDNFRICGLHFRVDKKENSNLATPMNVITKDIESKINEIGFNRKYTIKTENIIQNLIILQDARIAASTNEGKIIVYKYINKNHFFIDLIIYAFQTKPTNIYYFTQLENNNLLVCGKAIKIIKFKLNWFFQNSYDFIQKIEIKESPNISFNKAIEFNNDQIIACSNDSRIFIFKYNKEFSKEEILNLREEKTLSSKNKIEQIY